MITMKLRSGQTVLAKKTKHGTFPSTYANLTQAKRAAEKAKAEGLDAFVSARWPFVVVVNVESIGV